LRPALYRTEVISDVGRTFNCDRYNA